MRATIILPVLALATAACASGGAFDAPAPTAPVAEQREPPKEEFTGDLAAYTRTYAFRTDAKQAFEDVKRSGQPAMVYYVDPA